jgi:hypothetical protein
LDVTNGLDITSFDLFSGATGSGTLVATGVNVPISGASEWMINPVSIPTGSYYLEVVGGLASPATTGAYSGVLNLNAVPEPSLVLLLGIGLMGTILAVRGKMD